MYNSLKSDIEITLVAYINGILKNKKIAGKSKTRSKISSVFAENNKNIREVIKNKTGRESSKKTNKNKIVKKIEEDEIEDAIIVTKTSEENGKGKYTIETALEYYYSLNPEEQKKLEDIFLEECSKEKGVPIDILLQLKVGGKDFYNDTISKFLLKVLNSKKKNINKENIKEYLESLGEFEKLELEEKALKIFIEETNSDVSFLLSIKENSRKSFDDILEKYYLKVLEEK